MSKSVGMAIPITPENAPLLAVANGGLPVFYQEDPKCYFILPYTHDAHQTIVSAKTFHENWRFVTTEDPMCLVNIDEI